jgi:hypothetical protein
MLPHDEVLLCGDVLWRDIEEDRVLNNFDNMQKLGKNYLDATVKSFGALSKSTQAISVEIADYSKKSFEDGSKALEKLLGAKTLEQAVEIQTNYAKTAYEGSITGATKIGALYTDLVKETFKSFESNLSKAPPMK